MITVTILKGMVRDLSFFSSFFLTKTSQPLADKRQRVHAIIHHRKSGH